MAINLKKNMRNLMIVAVLLLIGRYAFHLHQQREAERFFADQMTREPQPTFEIATKSGDYYDYERMLVLLTKLREIKSAYHAKFTHETGRVHRLDIKEIKEVLADFYREKERFERYVLQVRYFYKGEIPRKRAYCLRDYSRVLEKAIIDLERILRNL
ncbi:hypothetical protein FJ365_01215 [Candidatus Dependentiae bacterium]|nr:hypothetical protein [Candidatus Dependentiae bacterium]